MLDEALGILRSVFAAEALDHHGEHYTAVADPMIESPADIPILVAGTWPNRRPFVRAAGLDGIYAVRVGWYEPLLADDVASISALIAEHRTADRPSELALSGGFTGNTDADRRQAEAYAAAGATMWVDGTIPRFEPLDSARERIRKGPPRP